MLSMDILAVWAHTRSGRPSQPPMRLRFVILPPSPGHFIVVVLCHVLLSENPCSQVCNVFVVQCIKADCLLLNRGENSSQVGTEPRSNEL